MDLPLRTCRRIAAVAVGESCGRVAVSSLASSSAAVEVGGEVVVEVGEVVEVGGEEVVEVEEAVVVIGNMEVVEVGVVEVDIVAVVEVVEVEVEVVEVVEVGVASWQEAEETASSDYGVSQDWYGPCERSRKESEWVGKAQYYGGLECSISQYAAESGPEFALFSSICPHHLRQQHWYWCCHWMSQKK